MRPSTRRVLPVIAVSASLLATLPAAGASAVATAPSLSALSAPLAGARLSGPVEVQVAAPAGSSVKFLLDGGYLGSDKTPPYTWRLQAPVGRHELKVRITTSSGTQLRTEAVFSLVAGATTSTPSAPAAPAPTSPAPPPAPAPDPAAPAPPTSVPGALTVSSVAGLRSALASAKPGAVITLADGEYVFRPRLVASSSGTPSAPITLRGSRAAIIRSTGVSGDYGLHITGSFWRVEGLTVAHANKGIVLDRSVGTVLDGVQVHDIGAEGVHFRSCSSDGVLRRSLVRKTGITSPQFGEGVYVGSANSNWAGYACTDGRDNSERVLVEDNVFQDIAAEGADLKEGTDSGILRRNVFDNVGFSGANSADSAVDAKGNGWLIEDNTVRGARGKFLDAFQTHSVYQGYGTGNVFRGNRVEGAVAGYGVAFYPALGNQIECSNSAPGAVKGLSSVRCR